MLSSRATHCGQHVVMHVPKAWEIVASKPGLVSRGNRKKKISVLQVFPNECTNTGWWRRTWELGHSYWDANWLKGQSHPLLSACSTTTANTRSHSCSNERIVVSLRVINQLHLELESQKQFPSHTHLVTPRPLSQVFILLAPDLVGTPRTSIPRGHALLHPQKPRAQPLSVSPDILPPQSTQTTYYGRLLFMVDSY